MARQIDLGGCQGQWLKVIARNPVSVCCDEALLICALRSVGVVLHPGFRFVILIDEVDGKPVTLHRWIVSARSKDNLYSTADLIKWWSDPAWQAANRTHEFAIACTVARNMGVVAAEVRETVPCVVVRHGSSEAHIPVNASPARRAHLIGQLEGRIALNVKFVEPEPQAA